MNIELRQLFDETYLYFILHSMKYRYVSSQRIICTYLIILFYYTDYKCQVLLSLNNSSEGKRNDNLNMKAILFLNTQQFPVGCGCCVRVSGTQHNSKHSNPDKHLYGPFNRSSFPVSCIPTYEQVAVLCRCPSIRHYSLLFIIIKYNFVKKSYVFNQQIYITVGTFYRDT